MRSLAVALLRIVALGMVGFALLVSEGTPAYAWSYPAYLNTSAATDLGSDIRAQVTTDGDLGKNGCDTASQQAKRTEVAPQAASGRARPLSSSP